MNVLHLSADFPDPFDAAKTRAVANLIEIIPEHEHQIYSLNRVNGISGHAALSFGPTHRAVAYSAPPKGMLLANRLDALADWIVNDMSERGLVPDLIHAHKLSIEGLAASRIADRLGLPLIVSSQGNTDLRVLRARPDLRNRWRQVWQRAAIVLAFAPWTADALAQLLGTRQGPVESLPCPTPADQILAPRITPQRILSVFGLDEFANKNAAGLIEAISLLRANGVAVELDIVGGGSATSFAHLAKLAQGTAGIRLLGPIRHDRLQSLMNRSALFAVPSRRESYGMVFAEALLAGCPVLHGRGNAITGYFERAPWAIASNGSGAGALAQTLKVVLQAQQPIKAALASAQRAGDLDLFRRPAIAQRYRRALSLALPSGTSDSAKAA